MAADDRMEDVVLSTRPRFRASDLPLSSAQRSSIDNLLHTIKKKGEFDTLRKQTWSDFVESVSILHRTQTKVYIPKLIITGRENYIYYCIDRPC